LASVVECVEALTIVLVVGVTINWKSSLWGAAAAFGVLALLVAIFGAAVVVFVPLWALRLVIGSILLLFGLQWLSKSVLRYSGLKSLHDEAAIYQRAQNHLAGLAPKAKDRFNGFGFATSFKAVLLEGLEVVFIVVSFGTSVAGSESEKLNGFLAASLGAFLAAVLVALAGLIARQPLTRIPENTLKYAVGLMIVSFGTFWAGEGLGIEWKWGDLTILVLAGVYLVASGSLILLVRSKRAEGRSV
jgi:uncharacterized membrane protein